MNDVKVVRLWPSGYEVWINGSKVDNVVSFSHCIMERDSIDTVSVTLSVDSFRMIDKKYEQHLANLGLKPSDVA